MTRDSEDFDVLHYLAVCAPSINEWLEAAFDAWDDSNGGDRDVNFDDRGRKVFWFKVGKSGLNNQIIDAMFQNDFMWGLSWYSSKRGGKFKFRTRNRLKSEELACTDLCCSSGNAEYPKPIYFDKVAQ